MTRLAELPPDQPPRRLRRSAEALRAKAEGESHERENMAIIGAHVLLYSSEPEALRAALRDVFGWKHVDAGHGWLIFALPPAELGVHPAEGPSPEPGNRHQFTLMCDDIKATTRDLRAKGIAIDGEPKDERFGITVMLSLPGGVEVMLYEPRHPIAIPGRG
jgi:predicted enzyme related to lactoylglutathione lyase